MILLKIDYREKSLLEYFLKLDQNVYQIKSESLDIGDVQIHSYQNQEDISNNSTKLELIFERKTLADLNSSIKDGRYHEQKARIVSNVERHRVCYIIEGVISALNTKSNYLDINAVWGAMIHSIYRDRLMVFRTHNTDETCDFILEIYKRFNSNEPNWYNFLMNNSLTKCLDLDEGVYKKSSIKKSNNLTSDVIFINMLSNIPGCSTKIAKKIVNIYPNMVSLVKELESNPDSLAGIQLDNKKIGPVLSKRIYEQLIG